MYRYVGPSLWHPHSTGGKDVASQVTERAGGCRKIESGTSQSMHPTMD